MICAILHTLPQRLRITGVGDGRGGALPRQAEVKLRVSDYPYGPL
jgi:hypothetical protein